MLYGFELIGIEIAILGVPVCFHCDIKVGVVVDLLVIYLNPIKSLPHNRAAENFEITVANSKYCIQGEKMNASIKLSIIMVKNNFGADRMLVSRAFKRRQNHVSTICIDHKRNGFIFCIDRKTL